MPIKDISKEEQSSLALSGKHFAETVKLTEMDKSKLIHFCLWRFKKSQNLLVKLLIIVNFGGTLPLPYYNFLSKDLNDQSEVPGATGQEVVNPAGLNRHTAWPLVIKASMDSDMRVRIKF